MPSHYTRIVVRKCDVPKWEELDYVLEDVQPPDNANNALMFDEQRDGGISLCSADVVDGCPMVGTYESSNDTPGELVAWDGETFWSVEQGENGLPTVEVGCDGPDEDEIQSIKEFFAFRNEVMLAILAEENPKIDWRATENGNTLIYDENGDVTAYIKMDDGRTLGISCRLGVNPGIDVRITQMTDEEIGQHINTTKQGWKVKTCRYENVHIDSFSRILDVLKEN